MEHQWLAGGDVVALDLADEDDVVARLDPLYRPALEGREDIIESVRLCLATGVAGLSIEDSTGDPGQPLCDIDYAVQRNRAARRPVKLNELFDDAQG